MEYQAVLTKTFTNESDLPTRVAWPLWLKIQRSVEAHGGLLLENYNGSQARQFARALRAALEPPAPKPAAATRFSVFNPAPQDPGLPLRDEAVQPTIAAVLSLFEAGGVRVVRAVTSALRDTPSRTSSVACRRESVLAPRR